MKTKTLVKLLLTFSGVAAISIGIALACAGDDGDWFGYSDFAPESFADKSYAPLFYSSWEMFYGIGYNDDHIVRFNDQVLKDWKNYMKTSIDEKDLRFFLLDEKGGQAVHALYEYIFNGQKSTTVTAWAKKLDYNNYQIKSMIEFLYFAKEVEKSSMTVYDYWDYDKPKEIPVVSPEVIAQIKSKYKDTRDPFLKNRYWFQTMKALFYSDTRSEAITFFEQTKNEVPKNDLYYRALAYVAGVNYKAENYARANYLYSRVFDEYKPLRTECAYSFHPQNEGDWQQALAMAKNNKEKAALWALLGYYNDEQRAVEKIYELDPQSPHLDYLLTRLINRQEEDLQSVGVESSTSYRAKLKEQVNQSVVELVAKIAKGGNTGKPYLWNLAAGYLATLDGNYVQAGTFYDKAEQQLLKKQEYTDQLRLLRFVNKLTATDKMDASSEKSLLSDLQWVYKDLTEKAPDNFRFQKALSWSKSYIASLYRQQNNHVFAQLFSPTSEFYYDNSNIVALENFLQKQNKSEFEKLAESIFPLTMGDLYEYQAVVSTFNDDIDAAYAYMQKAGERKDVTLLANPFNGFIKDCHDCEHAAPQKTKFSKLRFVEILQIMEGKIKKGEEVYNNNLLLGNAFYNITFYGNARVFYEGSIIGFDMGTFWSLGQRNKSMLLDMSLARKYYQRAYEAATTNEQKAKCSYLLAKCERNEYYTKNDMNGEWNNNNYADFLAWDGFKQLKTKYASTKYYKDVIAECEYFAKYVGK